MIDERHVVVSTTIYQKGRLRICVGYDDDGVWKVRCGRPAMGGLWRYYSLHTFSCYASAAKFVEYKLANLTD